MTVLRCRRTIKLLGDGASRYKVSLAVPDSGEVAKAAPAMYVESERQHV